jgi:hypothetical protein
MADVQIQQTPSSGSGSGVVWGIVVVILLAVIAWFVFGGGFNRSTTSTTKIDIKTPAAAPAPGGAPAAPAPSGGTKTP